ncbi:ribonuclease P protein component [Argonema galeatum]|uniref:ribonuclease P protein component n=1 Tax=Argonema galeatum TaxID=2942762 RepID=UPI00201121C6|nr:ribonuclease P protein component [Argonema galeatum A003/A1]
MALRKANRLKHRQHFSAVFRKGIRRQSANLTLRALKQSADSEGGRSPATGPEFPSRIGISVSLKVSKRAVTRNRIKRQIRAAFRHLLPQLKYGWWLVVVVKPKAEQCEYQQFLQELEQLLAEAEVLNGHSRGSLL